MQRGKIIQDEDGNIQGIEIAIDKFSTFTIVHMAGTGESIPYQSYIAGYPDGTFRPGQSVTRAELAVMLAQTIMEQELVQNDKEESAYSDVTQEHWAYDGIAWLARTGMMLGDDEGHFHPEAKVTRAEMAVIASTWLHQEDEEAFEWIYFTDTSNHEAREAIEDASKHGVMIGYKDGSFRPDRTLSRAEAVAVINLITNRPGLLAGEFVNWSDVPETHWAYGHIQSASRTFTAQN